MAAYREYYHQKGIYEACLYDGMKDLLRSLKEEGKTVAIASAKVADSVRTALEYLEAAELFDVVMGSNPDGSHSDKETLIREIVEELRLPSPAGIVFIGDSRTDSVGAKGAGVDFIAALYDRDRSEFDGLGVTKEATSVKELKNLLLAK